MSDQIRRLYDAFLSGQPATVLASTTGRMTHGHITNIRLESGIRPGQAPRHFLVECNGSEYYVRAE